MRSNFSRVLYLRTVALSVARCSNIAETIAMYSSSFGWYRASRYSLCEGNESPMWQSDETIGIRADIAPPPSCEIEGRPGVQAPRVSPCPNRFGKGPLPWRALAYFIARPRSGGGSRPGQGRLPRAEVRRARAVRGRTGGRRRAGSAPDAGSARRRAPLPAPRSRRRPP